MGWKWYKSNKEEILQLRCEQCWSKERHVGPEGKHQESAVGAQAEQGLQGALTVQV